MFLALIVFLSFSLPLIIAAYKDAVSMRIPNYISLILIAGFFIVLPHIWQGFDDMMTHIFVGLTFLFVGIVLFSFGWLGAGDGKLMAATALWMTWPDAVSFILYTTIFGAILGLFLVMGRAFMPVRLMTSQWAYTMFKNETKMPYGLAIAAGAITVLPSSTIIQYISSL